MSEILISDHDIVYDLAARYVDMGYLPVPVMGSVGKEWKYPSGEKGYVLPRDDGTLATKDEILDNFRSYPGCGIGIVASYLRNRSPDLLHIDVDIRSHEDNDGETLRAVATIIGTACPFRVGEKGGNFTVRYVGRKSLHAILVERKLPHRGIVTPTTITMPWLKSAGHRAKGIDLMGAGMKHSHVNVPPTRHVLASKEAGHDVFYEWREFPGTKTIMHLDQTPPDDLPELQEHHLLMLYQWAKNRTSALWNYLGNTSPGDHHHLMLSASTYMYHEGFTQSEIEDICGYEAERSSSDEQVLKDRRAEIQNAVRSLAFSVPNPKPAKEPKEAKPAKVPLERVMSEFLMDKYPSDDLAMFSALPYYWNGDDRWEQLTDVNHNNQWRLPYLMLLRKFDTAVHGQMQSAIRTFASTIPPRQAQPDTQIVPFNNGVVDIRDGKLYVVKKEDYIPAHLTHDWDDMAQAPLWEAFIRNLMQPPLQYQEDDTYRDDWIKACKTVEEFLGYCLVRSHQFQRLMFLIGKPGTGKSVLMKVFEGLLPKGWVSHVAMDALDDPNSRMQMAMAHANIAGEVGRRSRDVDDTLLKITAGEPVEVKLLYENRMQAVLPTRLIFHGNLPPDSTDGTGAMERRTIMLRTTDIKPATVMDYQNKLLEEAPGILRRLVEAYRRLEERRDFDIPSYAKEAASNMSKESNSAMMWLNECCVVQDDVKDGAVSQDLFDHYKEWSERLNMRPMSSPMWGKMLSAEGYHSIKVRMPGNHIVRYRRLKLISQGAGVRGGY